MSASPTIPPPLPAALADEFAERGYVILRGFLEHAVIAAVRAEAEVLVDRKAEALVAAGKAEHAFADEPFETRMYRLYARCLDEVPLTLRKELHLPGFFDLFFHSRLLDVAETFLGPEVRLYPNYSLRAKMPDHERTLVLWHQDGGYTAQRHRAVDGPVETQRMINLWTPLVRATAENGCMQFIPGTHKQGVVPHEDRGHYLQIAPEFLAPHEPRAVTIEADPGDVTVFHNLLYHRGLPNRSAGIRWSVDWRYQDATQPTLRQENGHLARSRANPERVVRSREEWAGLTLS